MYYTDSMQASGFEELHHTADWALRVWGVSLAELFEHAAQGMQAMMGIQTTTDSASVHIFKTMASDPETLLVGFLEEILYLLDHEKISTTGIEFDEVSETHLAARLTCRPIQSLQKEIKAVTFHELEIHKLPGQYETVLVFDV